MNAAISVRAWLLRAGLAAATASALAIVLIGASGVGVASPAGFAVIAAAVGTVAAPGTVLPLMFLIGVVLYRLATPGAAPDMSLAALIALVPLVHQLAAVCAVVPRRSRCEWMALRPATTRYLVSVVVAELILVVAVVAR